MFCYKCGKEFDDAHSFCPNCGAEKPSTAQSETQVTPSPETPPPQVAYPTTETPGQPIIPQPSAPSPIQMERPPSRASAVIIGVIIAVVVLVGLLIVAIAVPVYLNARGNAEKRTCQSNLRTVDGAIQAYESMFDNPTYPTSMEDMTQPGTEVLRSIPTCPSGDEPYIWVDGSPPIISCPNNASHTIY